MKAPDILAATHKLEDTGMDRSQSEAVASIIAVAVEPLATKEDLSSLRSELKSDLASMEKRMATKQELESLKVWVLTGMLGMTGSLLAIAVSIAFSWIRVGIGAGIG